MTVSSRRSFSDDDLTTPGHDRLVLWCYYNWRSIYPLLLDADWVASRLPPRPGYNARTGKDDDLPTACVYRPQLEARTPAGGWIDVLGTGRVVNGGSTQSWAIAVEVKTAIRSLGELLRQLRTYEEGLAKLVNEGSEFRAFYDKQQVVVCSPDDRYKDVLVSQGFAFLNPTATGQAGIDLPPGWRES